MTGKLILTGLKERLKVYAGIAGLYLLYAVLSIFSDPTPRMDKFMDWVNWSYEIFGVKIYALSFILLGMAAAALIVAEVIIFARDFYGSQAYLLFTLPVNGKQVVGSARSTIRWLSSKIRMHLRSLSIIWANQKDSRPIN